MTIQEIVREASFAEVALSADECLKCNVCNTVCPVARVTDLFPGPKYVGPQAQRFRVATLLPPQGPSTPIVASPDATVDYCSGCGMCTTACPADVKIAEMNSRSRAEMKAGHRPRFRDWLLGQTDLVGRLGRRVRAARQLDAAQPADPGADRVDDRHPPAGAAARLRRQDAPVAAPAPGRRSEPPPDRAVVLFHGCAANYYEPHVAFAAIEVLRRNGFETIAPEQVCCGLPFISNGLYSRARGKARRNLGVFADYARRGYRIVGTSTSCTHTLKAEYREMLDVDDDDAHAVSRLRPGTSASSSSTSTSRAASTRASVASRRRCRTMRRASSAATGSGCRRWTCSLSCRASAPSTWTTTAAGSPGRTG